MISLEERVFEKCRRRGRAPGSPTTSRGGGARAGVLTRAAAVKAARARPRPEVRRCRHRRFSLERRSLREIGGRPRGVCRLDRAGSVS